MIFKINKIYYISEGYFIKYFCKILFINLKIVKMKES